MVLTRPKKYSTIMDEGLGEIISNKSYKSMFSKTDVVFYLMLTGGVLKEVSEAWKGMKLGEPTDWVMIGLTVASGIVYALYDFFTGTTPTPSV